MPCPHCQAATRVTDSRLQPQSGYVRRIRRCRRCGHRMVTWESTLHPDAIAAAAARLRAVADEMEQPQTVRAPVPRLVPPTEAAA